MRRTLFAFSLALSLAGCTDNPTPDIGTEVFQTLPEAAADRRRTAIERWKAQAKDIITADRPDVSIQPVAEQFALTVSADGVERTIDLEPAYKDLAGQMGRSLSILTRFVQQPLARFDQERLAAMPFDQIRPRLRPLLLSREELEQVNANFPSATTLLHAHLVGAAGMHWMPVVRWNNDAFAAIPPERLASWDVSQSDLDKAALENLRREFDGSTAFETTRFGPKGNVGALLTATAPAEVVLLPEFLAAVRKQWNTNDDLALMPASRRMIRFVESKNTALLDQFYPQWERMVQETPQPLSRRVLLLSDKGIAPLDYNPPVALRQMSTTQPTLPGGIQVPGLNNRPTLPQQSPLLNIPRPQTQPVRPGFGQPPRPNQPQQRPYIAR